MQTRGKRKSPASEVVVKPAEGKRGAGGKCFQCNKKIDYRSTTISVFDEKTFCTDKCEEEWYDTCPECGEKNSNSCKCRKAGRTCPRNHHWHMCSKHQMRMPGDGHGFGGGCDCVAERKAQPADDEMLEFVTKKRKLTETQQLDLILNAFKTTRKAVTEEMHAQPLDAESSEDDDDK